MTLEISWIGKQTSASSTHYYFLLRTIQTTFLYNLVGYVSLIQSRAICHHCPCTPHLDSQWLYSWYTLKVSMIPPFGTNCNWDQLQKTLNAYNYFTLFCLYLCWFCAINPKLRHEPLIRLVSGSRPSLVPHTIVFLVHIEGAHGTTVHVVPPGEACTRRAGGRHLGRGEDGNVPR